MIRLISVAVGFFILGMLFCLAIFSFADKSFLVSLTGQAILDSSESFIDENSIFVYDDKVVIFVEGASVENYLNSGSMRPSLDEGFNSINVKPSSEDNISVGDIVSFNLEGSKVSHRVIRIGRDSGGLYFVTKGDNNLFEDDSIRFEDINSVVVGIIY